MAIITYPTEDYNSFIDLATATSLMGLIGNSEWALLSVTEQEQLIHLSFMYIKALANIEFTYKEDSTTLVRTLTYQRCPYSDAQLTLMNAHLNNNKLLLDGVQPTQPYTKAKVSSLLVEYNMLDVEHFYIDPLTKGTLFACLKTENENLTHGFTFGEVDI